MELREGELLAMEKSNVDFINRRLKVNKPQQYITGKGINTKAPFYSFRIFSDTRQ